MSTSSSDHPQSTKWPLQGSLGRFLITACLVILLFHAAGIAYRARHDPSELAFVVFTYSVLASLFVCLKKFERLDPDGAPEARERLKSAVWALSAVLNLAFAWRVAAVMPPVLAVAVWIMTAIVIVGGFYGLFMCPVGAVGKVDGARGYSAVENRSELEPEDKV